MDKKQSPQSIFSIRKEWRQLLASTPILAKSKVKSVWNEPDSDREIKIREYQDTHPNGPEVDGSREGILHRLRIKRRELSGDLHPAERGVSVVEKSPFPFPTIDAIRGSIRDGDMMPRFEIDPNPDILKSFLASQLEHAPSLASLIDHLAFSVDDEGNILVAGTSPQTDRRMGGGSVVFPFSAGDEGSFVVKGVKGEETRAAITTEYWANHLGREDIKGKIYADTVFFPPLKGGKRYVFVDLQRQRIRDKAGEFFPHVGDEPEGLREFVVRREFPKTWVDDMVDTYRGRDADQLMVQLDRIEEVVRCFMAMGGLGLYMKDVFTNELRVGGGNLAHVDVASAANEKYWKEEDLGKLLVNLCVSILKIEERNDLNRNSTSETDFFGLYDFFDKKFNLSVDQKKRIAQILSMLCVLRYSSIDEKVNFKSLEAVKSKAARVFGEFYGLTNEMNEKEVLERMKSGMLTLMDESKNGGRYSLRSEDVGRYMNVNFVAFMIERALSRGDT